MGVILSLNDKDILDVSNSNFSGLYTALLNLIEDENIGLPSDVEKILNRFEAARGGIGFEITDYIKTKQDFRVFNFLLKRALDEYVHEFTPNHQHIVKKLWDFYHALKAFEEQFKD